MSAFTNEYLDSDPTFIIFLFWLLPIGSHVPQLESNVDVDVHACRSLLVVLMSMLCSAETIVMRRTPSEIVS